MPQLGRFVDSRDGHVYRTVLMPDGKWWFAEDLAFVPTTKYYISGTGFLYCINNSPSPEGLPQLIPPGCRVPAEWEWSALNSLIDSAGISIRSATGWNSNLPQSVDAYKFNAKPSGVYNGTSLLFQGRYAAWWIDLQDVAYIANDSSAISIFGGELSTNYHALRFIVESGNIPDPTECAPVTYSPPAGTYGTPQTVALSTETAGASIYYTVDGSEPTAASPIYTAPLTISESTTVKAIAVKAGLDDSAVTSALYTILPPVAHVLFGAPFQGFERGYSLEISRKISEIQTLGSAPVLLPYAPADKDEWIVDAELWVTAAQAAEIQARVPPKGSPLERAIGVPPRSGANTFAGLAPFAPGIDADTYIDPIVLSLESLGQKAVAVDLYGFRIRFSLSCSSISNPYSSNPATPPTATPPAWLNQKFRVHQIEDCSIEERVISPTGKWSSSPNSIKAGRGLPLSITLDYLTQERADELVAFFRGIRSSTFTAPLDFPGATSTSFVARKLSLTRPGLHWEGTLEVYQA